MGKKKNKSPEPPKSSLPESIYIYMEADGDEFFPIATHDINSIESGVEVGEYVLNYTAKKVVEHRLD